MKRTILGVLVFTLFASALHATSVSAATSVFATGMSGPESITPTSSGSFYVTDFNGTIWSVPAAGGAASSLVSVGPKYSLRSGLFLPNNWFSPSGQPVGGQFFVTGGTAKDNGTGFAGTMNAASPFTVTTYALQADSLWTQSVLPPRFGSYSGDILVTNQGVNQGGHGQSFGTGSVDFFAPNGTIGRLAPLPSVNVPFGAALAPPGFGKVGGTLLVSDALGPGIVSVDSGGNVAPFATIPLTAGQSGLRQIAFAPPGFGRYGGDLFVGIDSGVIDVVDGHGSVVGQITGNFNPRGLLFTTISGNPALLFSDEVSGDLLMAGPGDVVPVS